MKVYGILGTEFCGSTLLQFILGSSYEVFSTGEVNSFQHYKEKAKCNFCKYDCDFWNENFRNQCINNPNKRYDLIRDRVKQLDLGSILLHSDKDVGLYIRYIKDRNQIDKFIVLFKKPEAFYFSYSGHFKNNDIEELMNAYMRCYSVSSIMDKCIFVNYEDLALNPEKVVPFICKKLCINYDIKMLNYWENKFHALGGNTGVYLNFWKPERVEKKLKTDYWKKVYSGYTDKEIKDRDKKIVLDERWKIKLSEIKKSIIKNHKKAQSVYNNMMNLREYKI